MTEIVKSCPLCGANTTSSFDQRQFRERSVSNVICLQCGLVYQSPRMTEAEQQAFYEAEYRLLYQGQEGPDPKDLAVQAARSRAILAFIGKHIRSCNRILDIGCSSGILLQQVRDLYHSQAIGIEPGTRYRQHAQSLGLDIYSSLDELQHAGLASFELVSMIHVLEHLPNPVEYLQDVRENYLTVDGWLLLEVPNLYAHDCFEVAHLISFSPHTLIQMVKKAGYKVIQLRTHGQPRSMLIPLYLTMLAQPDQHSSFTLKPDYQVRAHRRLGLLYRRLITRLFPDQAWISPEKLLG